MATIYESPLGRLTIDEDGGALRGLWMEGQAHFPEHALGASEPASGAVAAWLADYFAGKNPELTFEIVPTGSDYQHAVWSALREVPYGHTVTYQQLADVVSAKRGTPTAARAIGGALGKNQISIVIPCHRVVGTNGKITGYAGGIDRKIWLLEHEASTL